MEKDVRNRQISRREPYAGIRRVIGTRMRQSLDELPQGTVIARFDLSEVVEYRKQLKDKGRHVSYTDLFAKAVCVAMQDVPVMNAARIDEEILYYKTVNIGIAVKADDALVVPVVTDVECKALIEIAEETRSMIQNAREGRFDRINMAGATTTINNLGMYNIEGCTPFLNPPETSIIAFGKIQKEPWVIDGDRIAIRDVATISVTVDHSVMDGGQVGEFMSRLKEVLLSIQSHVKWEEC